MTPPRDRPPRLPTCPRPLCGALLIHRHTEDGGIQHEYAPRTSANQQAESTYDVDPMRPGDWVQVWGQVVDATHPEVVAVTTRSKTDEFSITVRRDLVVKPVEPPEFAAQCTSLIHHPNMDSYLIVRCSSRLGSGHEHEFPSGGMIEIRWTDEQAIGHIEVS